jgi:tRNA dimethylallyltransferase
MPAARPAVVVLGPTASGKSDTAMAAAVANPGTEIVVCDAMQVYRGMDIGTAKPTAADRQAVVHHCLDLVGPNERFTVADYQSSAREAVAAVQGADKRALVVAGTGLYLTALIDDLEFPGEFPEVRADLEREPDTTTLFARLARLDPVSAERIEATNRRRIIRALEVCIGSCAPFSATGPGTGAYPDNGVVQIGIKWEREILARRIEERVQRMMDAGLLDEVRRLLAGPVMSKTASQALGYAELTQHLRGRMTIGEAIAAIVTHTRQFAVRQERWFRRDPRIRWIHVERDPVEEVVPAVAEHLR